MNVLGVDPSTKATGWAVMNEHEELVDYGVINGLADNPESFHMLYEELDRITAKYAVEKVRCETQFIGPGRQTSIKLIRPTGVILAVTGKHALPFDFSTPASWRKTIHGKGKWKKRDTYEFIKDHFGLELASYNKDNDKTDAIGIAWSLVKP